MNVIEKAKELIYRDAEIPQRVLYLAYLQLCILNPALHPDDHMCAEGGYCGWQVLLVHKALNGLSEGPVHEMFHYPTAFLKVIKLLERLNQELEAVYRKTDADLDYQMWGNVTECIDFITSMETRSIQDAIDSFQKLYLYEVGDDEAEDAEIHTLRDCADVLQWVAQFR